VSKNTSEQLFEKIRATLISIDRFHLNLFEQDPDNISVEEKKVQIRQQIMQLYDASIIDDFYYLDCPLEVYKNTYAKRFYKLKNKLPDADEIFFLKSELKNLVEPTYETLKENITDFRNYCRNDFYNTSFHSKISFIRDKLSQFGWSVIIKPEMYVIPKIPEYFSKDTSIIDYSFNSNLISKQSAKPTDIEIKNPKQLTANQIVLLLQEIGFFIHPEIEDASKVKQAELIGLIAGLNQKNIKTNIQKLDKKPLENGLNYQKDIDKINKILDDLT
jgi:hypothetical protein